MNEVRAWSIQRDTKAPQAAGIIHSDFEKVALRQHRHLIRVRLLSWPK
jgi:ribosome-binding ATPase YchF (GTP1/OBG family)